MYERDGETYESYGAYACPTFKTCCNCRVTFLRKQMAAGGSRCKPCTNEYARAWRRTNYAGEVQKIRQRLRRLSEKGLTAVREQQILAAQGGCCAICRREEPGHYGTWHIDHDHACCPGQKSCGKCVRGLLCSRCNTALGLFFDNPQTLAAAADYLAGSRAQ